MELLFIIKEFLVIIVKGILICVASFGLVCFFIGVIVGIIKKG